MQPPTFEPAAGTGHEWRILSPLWGTDRPERSGGGPELPSGSAPGPSGCGCTGTGRGCPKPGRCEKSRVRGPSPAGGRHTRDGKGGGRCAGPTRLGGHPGRPVRCIRPGGEALAGASVRRPGRADSPDQQPHPPHPLRSAPLRRPERAQGGLWAALFLSIHTVLTDLVSLDRSGHIV